MTKSEEKKGKRSFFLARAGLSSCLCRLRIMCQSAYARGGIHTNTIPYAQPPIGSLRFDAPQKYAKYETFDALNFVSPVGLHSVAQLSTDFVGFLVTVRISPALVANPAYLTLDIVNVHSPLRNPSYTPIKLRKSLASWQILRTKVTILRAR